MEKLTKTKIKKIMKAQDKWKAFVSNTTELDRDVAMTMLINKYTYNNKGVYYILTKNYLSTSSQATYDDLKPLKQNRKGIYTLVNMPDYNKQSEKYLKLNITLEDLVR